MSSTRAIAPSLVALQTTLFAVLQIYRASERLRKAAFAVGIRFTDRRHNMECQPIGGGHVAGHELDTGIHEVAGEAELPPDPISINSPARVAYPSDQRSHAR